MKVEETKLGLKRLTIILDDELAKEIAGDRSYAKISVLTLNKLDLPGFRLAQSKVTGLVELDKSPEEILAGFSPTARNEIHRTMKPDFPMKFIFSPHITAEAYSLYLDFERKLNRVTYPLSHFAQCWEISAVWNGEVVSVVWMYESFPVARNRHMFSARHEKDDKLIRFANRRVIYEAAIRCKEKGCSAMDLAGIVPHSQDFKWSFHPTVARDYVYVRTSVAYRFFERIVSFVRRIQQRNYKRRVIIGDTTQEPVYAQATSYVTDDAARTNGK